MRVTQPEICQSLLSDLETLNDNLSTYSNQVSSGKLLNHLSDSPSGSAELVSLDNENDDIDQYVSNANTANLYLGTADSTLEEVNNLVTSIYTDGSQAASQSLSSDDVANLAEEVRSLQSQIVTLANTAVNGRYLFSGSIATTAPFALNGDTVSWQGGNSDVNTLSVDSGTNVQTNYFGEAVFGSVFSAINSLLTAMDANDTSGIQTALAQFAPAQANLSTFSTQAGSNMSMLQNVQTSLQSEQTSVTQQISQIGDADMAQATVQLDQTQTALDAAMSAAKSVLGQSNLFDILG